MSVDCNECYVLCFCLFYWVKLMSYDLNKIKYLISQLYFFLTELFLLQWFILFHLFKFLSKVPKSMGLIKKIFLKDPNQR